MTRRQRETKMESKYSNLALVDFVGKRVAVLTTQSSSGETGGAERFFEGLAIGLKSLDCNVTVIPVIADESSFDQIKKNYESCGELDLSEFDVVISTKAPTFAINHPNHVIYLVHTMRVFDDMFECSFPGYDLLRLTERAAIHELDYCAMSSAKAIFTIGHEVTKRLDRWRGLSSEVIHPPLGVNGFVQGEQKDYFFLPGRLHPWKRVDLVIKAFKLTDSPLQLIIAGKGEAENELKVLAAGDERIKFVGRLEDDQLLEYYSHALAIPFTPIKEDDGYVTLEAFASGKPVITCSDSGEPNHFVKHMETGLVAEPTPESLARQFEWIFLNKKDALLFGEKGRKLVDGMSWSSVAKRLVSAGLANKPILQDEKTNVVILDMQPIDPPIGGGRMRLLGLYHNLGDNIEATYVGSYDWPGEEYRKHRLSPGLVEIDVPLSSEHHAAAKEWSFSANGKVVIDVVFSQQAHLSTEYLDEVVANITRADVVVFSHPWVYPLIDDSLLEGKTVIYDSQNVEGYLRAQLFDHSNPSELSVIKQVIADEYSLGKRADLIFACSQEDLLRFKRVYDFKLEKMRVIPNGVMAFHYEVPDEKERLNAKKQLKLDLNSSIAIFIGSAYGPNVDGANFIINELAVASNNVIFVIAGGVGNAVKKGSSKNVIITGMLSEDDKRLWLNAADFAVNPMFSGSGTNIKMFDFMSMGLPTITTQIGARGIELGGVKSLIIVEPTKEGFIAGIESISESSRRYEIGSNARKCVTDGYAWERISALTGKIFESRARLQNQPIPFFSVVIPSYNRHDKLAELMICLQNQLERDFEVIVIDQSDEVWDGRNINYGFPLTYYQSPVKGAVRARNTGAMLAQGKVIAFTDDDCCPETEWLVNSRKYFSIESVAGLEGIIVSDHYDDPAWRPVTNVGFKNIGFMTANLMVRTSIFHYLGGFDLQFDNPHFREDTDFGWRVEEIGMVPYATDVVVYHPAQPRSLERESSEKRVKFFQKDVLLYHKHPAKYHELFLIERHYEITKGFKENLLIGFEKEGIEVPVWMIELFEAYA